jgi:hypothetical protein
MASDKARTVNAHYESLTDAHDFNIPISTPCPPNPTTKEKTSYLSELRANSKKLQADINAFLTAKMAEDKAREADTTSTAKAKADDEREEENYGEEAAEDEGWT